VGVESTILACLPGGPVTCLRAGGTSRGAIAELISQDIDIATQSGTAPISPGQLSSHYATRAPLRLDALSRLPGETYLAFGRPPSIVGMADGNLSPAGDVTEAAAKLYGELRRLDELMPGGIAVAPIREEGLGEAINDRLRRAALR
jgi:L-threonylcarbamoyladenylate synthase